MAAAHKVSEGTAGTLAEARMACMREVTRICHIAVHKLVYKGRKAYKV